MNSTGFMRLQVRRFLDYHPVTDEKVYSDFKTILHKGGIEWKPNLLTNAARDKIHNMVYINQEPLQRGFGCIALTQTALTPAATDTTLSGEITGTSGLARAEATNKVHTTGTNTSLIEHTFTTVDAFNSPGLRGAALFDQLSGGVMGHINSFSTQALSQFDQIKVSWIVTAGQ